jgi:NitT/TauT family transport system substrate-binding protein
MQRRHVFRSFRAFALTLVTALVLGSLGTADAVRAQSLLTVRLAGVPTDDLTPVYYAIKEGLYRKAGLDLQVVPTSSGTAATTALVAGAYEMSKGSLISGFVAHLRDLPLVMVANGAIWDPKVPFSMMLVAKDSAIKTGADMDGKTIGVPALNDLNTLVSSAWVDQNGGDSKTLKYVEIPNSVAADALASHRIDATVMQDPQMAAAVDSGKARELAAAYSAVSTHFVFGAYFANKAWAEQHVDAVRAFARITYAAAAYTNTHHAETAPMMAAITKIPLAVFEKMGRVDGATTADPSLIQPLIDAAAKYHQIPRDFPAKEMFFSGLGA